jgi:hypothetical protein
VVGVQQGTANTPQVPKRPQRLASRLRARKTTANRDLVMHDQEDAPVEQETSNAQNTSPSHVIERFLAERSSPEGLEILVQWEGYSKRDSTWELETSLAESAPETVRSWRARSGNELGEEEVPLYEVEKILMRGIHEGEDIYVVKWKGYPLPQDMTIEPCERLKVDVPLIVNEFEQKRFEPKSSEQKRENWWSRLTALIF